MTILSKAILSSHGASIDFADCSKSFGLERNGLPDRSRFEKNIFFEFVEPLLDVYCDATQCYSIFDPHTSVELIRPSEVRALAAGFVRWAEQICNLRGSDLERLMRIHALYHGATIDCSASDLTPEDLRVDLVETALFIANRLTKMARSNRVLFVDSI